MDERKVDVGFVGECEPWKLHAKFFPSKVGGRPAWLSRRPPQPSALVCRLCGEPTVFLCQIYAPIDDCEDAFHRALFVFVCKNGNCCRPNDASNFKVFRSQLRRDNEFYASEPAVEDENDIFVDAKCPKLCVVCGCRGPNHCSKCKRVNYCSRSHQIYDWKNGHKDSCAEESVKSNSKNSILFPEWELIIERENDSDDSKEVSVEEEMKVLENLVREKKAGSLIDQSEEELEAFANKNVHDKTFGKFKKRISRDPEQVVRYDRGGEPLWISSISKISTEEVPACEYCNGERQFECQIMPQLLNFLDLDSGSNCVDWGILAIYSCKNHCTEPQETSYKTEFIHKQDIVKLDSSPKEDR